MTDIRLALRSLLVEESFLRPSCDTMFPDALCSEVPSVWCGLAVRLQGVQQIRFLQTLTDAFQVDRRVA